MRRRRSTWWAMALALTAAGAGMVMAAACGGDDGPPALHQMTRTYDFTIKPDQAPPHSNEDVHYVIQIFDLKTRQPIERGDGQLFAGKPIDDDIPSGPQAKTWDAMTFDPAVGGYRAKLNFTIAGTWAVAIRFRRDSLHPLERTDWMQDVLAERAGSAP